jgi:hypothetical protein
LTETESAIWRLIVGVVIAFITRAVLVYRPLRRGAATLSQDKAGLPSAGDAKPAPAQLRVKAGDPRRDAGLYSTR